MQETALWTIGMKPQPRLQTYNMVFLFPYNFCKNAACEYEMDSALSAHLCSVGLDLGVRVFSFLLMMLRISLGVCAHRTM